MILSLAMVVFAFACLYITWEEISTPPPPDFTPLPDAHRDDFSAWEKDL